MEKLIITNTDTNNQFVIQSENAMNYFNDNYEDNKDAWGINYTLSAVENIDVKIALGSEIDLLESEFDNGKFLKQFIVNTFKKASFTKTQYLNILKSNDFQSIWILLEIGQLPLAKETLESLAVNATFTQEIKDELVNKFSEIINA